MELGTYNVFSCTHVLCVSIIFHVYREATDVPAATNQTLELSKFSEETYE